MDEATARRFWSKVDVRGAGECWEWIASLDGKGYGQFTIGSKTNGTRRPVRAHRVAYEAVVGQIPAGLDIDHTCRNRSCVNPYHLEPVTRSENLRRGYNWEREKTHCPAGHPYSDENTYRDQGRRRCRTCLRAQSRARYRRCRGR